MSVEMKLELGHRASMRDKPTPEGFTHDWTVFVKGCEGSNISHFVEKVVFHLHESFPKPKRVVKETPYQVSESGYAGFIMPIEIYFRSKEEPKKVRFEYDLFLRLEGSPVYNIRVEKMTFQNPSEEFRRKLLKARSERATSAGGGNVSLPTLAVAPIQHIEERRSQTHTRTAPIAEKRPKLHKEAKEPPPKSVPTPPPLPPPVPAPKPSQPFENIFGEPIKAKHSPDANVKKEASHSSHQKPAKNQQAPVQCVNPNSKETKPVSKEVHHTEGKEAKLKTPSKAEKEVKAPAKRPLSPDKQNHVSTPSSGSSEKKRKHATSEKSGDSTKLKENKESRPRGRPPSSSVNKKEKEKHKSSSHHKDSSNHKFPSPKALNTPESKPTKNSLKTDDIARKPPLKLPHTPPEENYHSPSPPARDIDDDFASHSSSDDEECHAAPPPPPPPVPAKKERESVNCDIANNHSFTEKPVEQSIAKYDVIKPKSTSKTKPPRSPVKNPRNKQNGTIKEKRVSPVNENSPKQENSYDASYHQELVVIQKKIMAIHDHSELQRIVDVIEKTGKFEVTTTSFDFDLCSLDRNTVYQLKNCLAL